MVSKQKILIVDDDNNIAELIALYLTKECFETKIVNDGEEALKEFASFRPDLIIRESTAIRSAVKSVIPPMSRSSCSQPRERLLTKFSDWNWVLTTI